MRTLTSFDVDTDALADTFDRMADGLRSGDVLVECLEAHERANVADAVFRFKMDYKATHGFVDVTDTIEYDATHYLRFADEYVDPILSGDKTATARIGFERDFDRGDVVDLIDQSGDKFAEATVDVVFVGPIEEVARRGIGHYSAVDPDELVERLRPHYEDTIGKNTTVTAFVLRHVEPTNERVEQGADE